MEDKDKEMELDAPKDNRTKVKAGSLGVSGPPSLFISCPYRLAVWCSKAT